MCNLKRCRTKQPLILSFTCRFNAQISQICLNYPPSHLQARLALPPCPPHHSLAQPQTLVVRMRLMILETPDQVATWTATYVKKRILAYGPTAERPFVLGW